MPKMTVDGVDIEITQQEWEALFPPPNKSADIERNILNAPQKGFGGPNAKDLFNGNR